MAKNKPTIAEKKLNDMILLLKDGSTVGAAAESLGLMDKKDFNVVDAEINKALADTRLLSEVYKQATRGRTERRLKVIKDADGNVQSTEEQIIEHGPDAGLALRLLKHRRPEEFNTTPVTIEAEVEDVTPVEINFEIVESKPEE